MQQKSLYVIGNGFDLHHGIQSSYGSFGQYVQQQNPFLYETFERYFSFDGNWSNLEETLAQLDVHSIIEDASDYLVSYAAEEWSDAYHHDYQYEVNRIVEALSEKLKKIFTEWVFGLDIPGKDQCTTPLLPLNVAATFITFNYTHTLQKLYLVPQNNVLHIHNEVVSPSSDLVLGHAVAPSHIVSLNHGADFEAQDVRVTEGNEILDRYFSLTYKPTAQVIQKHAPFFSTLSGIREITVIGHSLSEVDLPYFQLIESVSRNSGPSWSITYRSPSSVDRLKKAMSTIGVAEKQVKYVSIAEL